MNGLPTSTNVGEAEREALRREVAQLIVSTLRLEISASDLTDDEALFGEKSALGLDSIDALEIALVIEHQYGAKIGAEDEDNENRFASVRSLAAFIEEAGSPTRRELREVDGPSSAPK